VEYIEAVAHETSEVVFYLDSEFRRFLSGVFG
jgi:hypothetical protein